MVYLSAKKTKHMVENYEINNKTLSKHKKRASDNSETRLIKNIPYLKIKEAFIYMNTSS